MTFIAFLAGSFIGFVLAVASFGIAMAMDSTDSIDSIDK